MDQAIEARLSQFRKRLFCGGKGLAKRCVENRNPLGLSALLCLRPLLDRVISLWHRHCLIGSSSRDEIGWGDVSIARKPNLAQDHPNVVLVDRAMAAVSRRKICYVPRRWAFSNADC
jgi:hypothetical protein